MENPSTQQSSALKAPIQLTRFRERIVAARRRAGYLQKDLAAALGLDPHSFSHKLHGSDGALLSHKEVKQVIKTLADWDAITHYTEAVELLALMGLKPDAFSASEWKMSPLSRLERTPPFTLPFDETVPSTPPSSRSRFPLPADLTSLIGRERFLPLVCERLRRADVRLVTLTGTGGIGKTRLALEVARLRETDFPDGVCFVSLAALRDPRLVGSAIAQALGLLDEHPYGNIDHHVQHFLREKHLLLLLDNFEHVLGAVSLVITLLERAPRVKILVTSRAVLGLYGEHLIEVPPLEMAIPQKGLGLEMLARIPALQLFVERAQAVQRAFALTTDNVSAVAELCTRLDGLPLAIELAAARIRFSSPTQVLEQLKDERNDLSKSAIKRKHPRQTPWRNLPERQQTLSQTIDWGYQLLAPGERQVFMRLGVFADGFMEEAFQALVASEGETGQDLLACLENLVNQSFVARRFFPDHEKEPAAPRFFLLETLRTYALEQLQQSGELTQMQWKHADYHVRVVETLGADLVHGPHMLQATQGMKQELENIREALAFVIEQQATEMAVRFCCALAPFWERQGFFEEGRRWISAALGLKEAPSSRLRAQLALIQGQLYWWEESYTQAQPLFEESRMLYQAEGEMLGLARATYMLAETCYYQRLWAQATHYFEKSLQLYQDGGDPLGMGNALAGLGGVALFQDYRLEVAKRRLYESLALVRPCQQPLELYAVLGLLGAVEYLSGNLPAAFTHVQEALRLFQTVGLEVFPGHNIATLLCGCSTFLGHVGAATVAAQLGGAAEALFERVGSHLASVYVPVYEEVLKRSRAQVGEAIWMHHWAMGKTLPLPRVIALALEACQSRETNTFCPAK